MKLPLDRCAVKTYTKQVEDIVGRFFIVNMRTATKHQPDGPIFDETGNKNGELWRFACFIFQEKNHA